jgi:hypothetical protein
MFYDIYLYTLCYYICCLLWRMYEMHLALFLKTGCDILFLNDELEDKSQDSFREYTEAAMRSLWSTMEILSRDVPRVFQVRI